jgi:hypothetical protein
VKLVCAQAVRSKVEAAKTTRLHFIGLVAAKQKRHYTARKSSPSLAHRRPVGCPGTRFRRTTVLRRAGPMMLDLQPERNPSVACSTLVSTSVHLTCQRFSMNGRHSATARARDREQAY